MSNITPSNHSLSNISNVDDLLKVALQKPVKEKPYTAQITRQNPTAFIFLLDQSGSMNDTMEWRGQNSTKAEVATMVINNILGDLLNRALDGNDTKHYFDLCVIGYGGVSGKEANFLWQGALDGKTWINTSELRSNKNTDYTKLTASGKRKTTHGWIANKSNSLTPMKDAMEKAYVLLKDWIVEHKDNDSFPPAVINITDGEATDAEPNELIMLSNKIKDLHTTDGNVLFFNININNSSDNSVLFPSERAELPNDENAETLFNMSSEMPKAFKREIANIKQIDAQKSYYAMAFNANASELIQFMNIGTSQTK